MLRVRKPPLPGEALDTAQPSGNGSLVQRDGKGRVLEGAVLNPLDRTPGSKNRIAEAFLKDFQEAWQQHGREAIARLAKRDPRSFVYAALALVPKEMSTEETQRIYMDEERQIVGWKAM